ncbi:hypothetical protein BH09ACT12_BH09ACT12_26030 [soil metagenome]
MRTFPSLVLACLPVIIAPAALAVPSGPTRPAPGAQPAPWTMRAHQQPTKVPGASRLDDVLRAAARSDGIPQTSDGVKGAIARPRVVTERGPGDVSVRRYWQVAPGITGMVWDERDARGPIRANLLTIDWTEPGISIDYANDGPVHNTAPVRTILARDHAIAGVNGDFFDIGDTGAPLGIGRDRQRGLLHGRLAGWNSAFYFTADGDPEIGPLQVTTTIKQRPGITITNVNSPSVAIGGIGVYTRSWGKTSGNRVVDGQTSNVRMVRVRNGVVVRNATRLPSNTTIKGRLLIGRGDGARALRKLKEGRKVTLVTRLQDSPAMAITGSQFLIDDGIIKVVDDREMHPRTAIGIDRDTHTILLLVIDGRQSFSRGYTMVELAQMMMDLGADEALNLDGGGSSTMLAEQPNGSIGLVNSPSDGVERSVANAVSVHYTAPASAPAPATPRP